MIAVMPLRPGALLANRYQIGRLIGQGGMGAVYEVVDQRLNARVALKQVIRTSPARREAFEREAKLLANLRHDSLPIVSDYFSEADSDFIVMEYIGGEDLGQIVQQQGALPVDQVVAWADQLLDVLSYLHTHEPPIIHRDIKPQKAHRARQAGAARLWYREGQRRRCLDHWAGPQRGCLDAALRLARAVSARGHRCAQRCVLGRGHPLSPVE